MKVGVEKTENGQMVLELVEPAREMTIQDLMRHTSGLIYGSRGKSLVNAAYIEAKIGNRDDSLQEFVTKLSKLPLRFSPGDRWEYGVSTDVLGRVIEVVSGKPLGEFLKERIFDPLGMVDTAFYVSVEKLGRAAQPWQAPEGPPVTPRFDVAQKPRFESGGGGLTGTMDDYLRFALMLADGGEFAGQRLLGSKTIEFMTADHVGSRPGRPPGLGFWPWLRGPHQRRRGGTSRFAWRVWLGGQRRNAVLDRSEGAVDCDLHGTGQRRSTGDAAQPVQDHGAVGDHELGSRRFNQGKDDMGRLDGKVAVITGATSGIGLRTAEVFVAEGAKVVVAGRRVPEGEALAKRLGASCVFRQTDVVVEEQMRLLITLAVEKFGRIDCLFNNAGGPAQTGGIEGLEVARFDAAMATLVRSVMLGMKHAAPHMKKQGSGSIINNGSIAGRLAGFSSSIVYGAAKAAVIHLTKCVAMELGESGVRVNSISPGAIATGIFGKALGLSTVAAEKTPEVMREVSKTAQPIPRAGLPDDIAHAAVFLASDDSTFINGHDLVVDGAITGGRNWTQQQQGYVALRKAFDQRTG